MTQNHTTKGGENRVVLQYGVRSKEAVLPIGPGPTV